jgi:putative acyl-CoA dehydrogenase
MECIGGSGVMEDSPMPRLFRESPVNAIWEGSGNIQCLDMLRAMNKTPAVIDAYFAEVDLARGGNPALDRHVAALREDLADRRDPEFVARDIADRLALGLQASLLVRHAPHRVADAFCRTRLERRGQGQYGSLPRGTDCAGIIERGRPQEGGR